MTKEEIKKQIAELYKSYALINWHSSSAKQEARNITKQIIKLKEQIK